MPFSKPKPISDQTQMPTEQQAIETVVPIDTLREQLQQAQHAVAAMEECLALVADRKTDYQKDISKFEGMVDAFNLTVKKIDEHIVGVKQLETAGQLTTEQYRIAINWISEVHGIPNSLVESAKRSVLQAEGAVTGCTGAIEALTERVNEEKARARQIERAIRVAETVLRQAEESKEVEAEGTSTPPPEEPEQAKEITLLPQD